MNSSNRFFTDHQIDHFRDRGFVICRTIFDEKNNAVMMKTAEEIQNSPETSGKWMKYFESSKSGQELLSRVENFIPFWSEASALISGSEILSALNELTGEDFLLMKEKLNFKMPGGGGFNPHQDGPAFTRFCRDMIITAMVVVDDFTIENGCLEVAHRNFHGEILPHPANGTIANEILTDLSWEPLQVKAGDVVLFSSFLPHRSGINNTINPRRAFFLTYNKAKYGNLREECLNYKRAQFPPRVERVEATSYTEWQKNLARSLI